MDWDTYMRYNTSKWKVRGKERIQNDIPYAEINEDILNFTSINERICLRIKIYILCIKTVCIKNFQSDIINTPMEESNV